MGRNTAFFQRAFKFTYYTRNRSPLQEKIKTINLKQTGYFFQLIRNKLMHVITSPNFAPPHFAARGIPKNTPHGTMEGHTAYIYMLFVYPLRMEIFSFSLYTKQTLALPDVFCKVWKRFGNAVPMGELLFLPVRLRECTNQLTHQVYIRAGM